MGPPPGRRRGAILKAVLLAGGEGTRLRPLTLTRPKPLVPVGNEPVISHVLRSLAQAGVSDAVVTVCYRAADVLEALGSQNNRVNLVYSAETEPLGTAGAVGKVAAFIDGTFVVASGDVFAQADVRTLLSFHRARRALATIALTEVENPSEYGVVALDDAGRIERFQEKPKRDEAFSNLVNAGIYVLEPDVLKQIPAGRPFDFSRDLFPRLLSQGEALYGQRLAGRWLDIGRPEDLLRANVEATERAGASLIAPDAQVSPSAFLASSAIGRGASVAADARIERSILLAGAVVGARSIVKNSIVGAAVEIGGEAEVYDAVLGDASRVASGARILRERVDPAGRVERGLAAHV